MCLSQPVLPTFSHYNVSLRMYCVRAQSYPTLCNSKDRVPLSIEFSRQEYWSGLPFPSLGDLPDPGIRPASPVSPALQVDSLPSMPSGKPFLRTDRLITHRGQSGHIGPAGTARWLPSLMCPWVCLSLSGPLGVGQPPSASPIVGFFLQEDSNSVFPPPTVFFSRIYTDCFLADYSIFRCLLP